jgi:hypothetical protein
MCAARGLLGSLPNRYGRGSMMDAYWHHVPILLGQAEAVES